MDSTLTSASDDLKADKEVVMAAVSVYGTMLEYASDELKTDKDVVIAAVRHHIKALEYASLNKEIMIALAENKIRGDKWLNVLKNASEELKADKDVEKIEKEIYFRKTEGRVLYKLF